MATYRMDLGCSSQVLPNQQALVLAIDDDNDNLALLSCVLELLDCEVVGHTSGTSALAIAQERQPNLILLDIMLPDISGIDLVHQLKQDPRTRHIPVVAVTGMATSENRADLLNEGFANCLSKPYMVDELEALVRSYLRQSL